MAKNKQPDEKQLNRESTLQDIRSLDDTIRQLMKDNVGPLAGGTQTSELNSIYDEFSSLVKADSYNFMKTKTGHMSSYNYLSQSLLGKPIDKDHPPTKKDVLDARLNMEKIFQNGDSQSASMFLNQSSDIQHICDEIESICAYLWQLDEGVMIFRDNIMNSEQSTAELPFDIKFGNSTDNAAEYQKIATDAIKDARIIQKLNDHIVPKTIKFGRYYVMTIPYSEIGVRMLSQEENRTKNIFNYVGPGYGTGGPVPSGIHESSEQPVDESYTTCMESVDTILDALFSDDGIQVAKQSGLGEDKDRVRKIIQENISNLLVSEEPTPPNVTGISESTFGQMDEEMKKMVDKALKENNKKFQANIRADGTRKNIKNADKHFIDATVDPDVLDSIPGCYIKLVDPRQIVPIKIFDHVLGYYYFENYDYARIGTSITDILSNQINFNDQDLVMDNIVGSVLKNLKYGDLLESDNDFKSLILNCVLYADRRQNPIRMKFVPAEYVTEFRTNCDENGNGQPVLLKSLVYGRLYVSLLLFMITTLVTKSTDTEFYYLKDGLISQSYEDQVADIIEQFRNSNVDISQIINGNLIHGNRAVNKRYFMCTGTQEQKPFDMEVISGQQVDTHNEFLTDLKKMAIGSMGIPSLAIDYMDEVEFATIAKMSNSKTSARSNNIQIDLNPSITDLCMKIIKYSKPNAIPQDELERMECELRKVSTINNNISADEINNNIATVDNMMETWYGGQNTETPPAVEYEKEEVRKQLIMKLSPSLPWGFMESTIADAKVNGKLKASAAALKKAQEETTEA